MGSLIGMGFLIGSGLAGFLVTLLSIEWFSNFLDKHLRSEEE